MKVREGGYNSQPLSPPQGPHGPEGGCIQTVMVQGLSPNTQTAALRRFFQSEAESGGGPVRAIKHHPAQRNAFIMFQSPQSK